MTYNEKVTFLAILLLMVVLVSGCVDDMFGSGEGTERPDDVVLKESEGVTPNPPIRSGNTFTYEFYLENPFEGVDTRVSRASEVEAKLYDMGRCSRTNENTYPNEQNVGDLYPGASQRVIWEFEAPSSEQLGHVSGNCPLRYMISYDFDAYTQADVIFASQEEVQRAEAEGEDLDVSPTVSQSEGPLKVDVEFGSEQPFIEGTEASVVISVRNIGDGNVEGNTINEDELNINLEGVSNGIGDCDYPSDDEGEIRFIDGETPVIRCNIEVDVDEMMETHSLNVNVEGYRYVIYGSRDVSIRSS